MPKLSSNANDCKPLVPGPDFDAMLARAMAVEDGGGDMNALLSSQGGGGGTGRMMNSPVIKVPGGSEGGGRDWQMLTPRHVIKATLI